MLCMQAIGDDFNTEFDYEELDTFIMEHEEELGSANRTAHQMLESTRHQCARMLTFKETVSHEF